MLDNEEAQEDQSNKQELASKKIQIQSKRFYIDVKENKRGRFIKIAEISASGSKNRIIMSMSAAAEFKRYLGVFSDFNLNLDPTYGNANGSEDGDGVLKSQTIIADKKRYYLDLKENQRGRFLKVSMLMNRAPRTQIAIPAQGLIEFNNELTELLEQYGTTTEETKEENIKLPDNKALRADNKTFYFDCGSNPRGVFLRISEVRPSSYRTSITVPEDQWESFSTLMKEFIDQVETEKSNKKAEVELNKGSGDQPSEA